MRQRYPNCLIFTWNNWVFRIFIYYRWCHWKGIQICWYVFYKIKGGSSYSLPFFKKLNVFQWGSITHLMAVPVPSISCCVLNHHNLFYKFVVRCFIKLRAGASIVCRFSKNYTFSNEALPPTRLQYQFQG